MAGVSPYIPLSLSGSAGEAKYTEPIPAKAHETELDLVQVLDSPP